MLIDFDKKGMPAATVAAIAAAGGFWPALFIRVPALAAVARVSRASTSMGLRRIDTGEPMPGSGGEHHYILVLDATDIGRDGLLVLVLSRPAMVAQGRERSGLVLLNVPSAPAGSGHDRAADVIETHSEKTSFLPWSFRYNTVQVADG